MSAAPISPWEQFLQLFNAPDRDQAAVELAARGIAQREGVSVAEVYSTAGGQRPLLNPEGRGSITALSEGVSVVASQLPDVPQATLNVFLRAIRGGDMDDETDWLDRAVTATDVPVDPDQDPNYANLQGIGESLGFSLMSLAAAGAGALAGSPGAVPGQVAGAMAGTAAVAYRGSRDQFLSRARKLLDDQHKKVHGRPLTDKQWAAVAKDFDAAATKYGAWETIPEMAGNLIFLRALSLPLRAAGMGKMADVTQRVIGTLAAEQATETMTGYGQAGAEAEVGMGEEKRRNLSRRRSGIRPYRPWS
jgi:hypothetical protein